MKILLAEDTVDLNRVVAAMLTHEGYEVECTFDGEEALTRALEEGYDGIILDIMMPKKDGIEVLKELRARRITSPVLLLTAKAEVDDKVEGLDAGADDYLPKPFAMKELMARVRAMTRRHVSYDTETVRFGDFTLDPETMTLSAVNSIRLSTKEYELMQFLTVNPDRELQKEHILSEVWAVESEADAETLWLYVNFLRRKLDSIGSTAKITGEKGGTVRLMA